MIRTIAASFLILVFTAPAVAQTQARYARTSRQGHTRVFMYLKKTSFCTPSKTNVIRIYNNTAVEVLKSATVQCGTKSAALVKASIVEGPNAGKKGYFLKTDLTPAPDLSHP